ncbi:DUF6449 domain-containing protein [Halobacillus faecis]|uniref:DUF6449 domain-containing protein n=1 Tax=Halobacillus faecis TaxID=360184 RepID=A0A511WXH2_9BACI|nr:DUF6449 domain-containing protein [Halobacillus faecis]GEN54998.1 hypothetical protein HFA01_32600 [Halobacillus faecis]
MRSKTSSFNKEIIKQDFRNVGWISIVYFLGLFFIVPMQLFMVLSREEPIITDDRGLFGQVFAFELQVLFLLVMPLLMAVFLFRYLHVKGASNFAHSFPMRRGKLFNHHIFSGIILLLLPILLNYLILLIASGVTDVTEYYTITNASYWLWLFVTMSFLIFIAGVFVGTLTGLSAVQGILTYILLFLPAGLYALTSFHLSTYIKGYSADMVLESSFQYFSPLADLLQFGGYGPDQVKVPVEVIALLIYGLVAVAFYAVSLWLYKNRSIESAGRALAVSALNPVFTFGVTFCFALFGGMYFTVSQYAYTWMIAGYFIGGTFGFAAATMLLEKTWRVFNWKHLKRWSGYGLAVAILVAIIPLLWQNYESYVPAQSEVEKVYISGGYWQYRELTNQDIEIPYITSEEAIQSSLDLHEQLIEISNPLSRGEDYFFFVYQLEDGSEIYRQYRVDEEVVREEKKAVYETKEYKKIKYPVLGLESSDVNQLVIHPNAAPGEEELYDPEKISAFMEVLKQDIHQLSYEQMMAPQGLSSGVSFTLDGMQENPYHLQIYPSFENTVEWMKREGFYEKMMIQAEDIQHAEVYKWPEDRDFPHDYDHYVYNRLKEDNVKPLEVSESDQIVKLLNGQENQESGNYIVAFYFDERNENHYNLLSFDEGDAPNFIKEHFE